MGVVWILRSQYQSMVGEVDVASVVQQAGASNAPLCCQRLVVIPGGTQPFAFD